jgi:flagellar biosynthetic protein FlhB
MSDDQERTEEATQSRRDDFRKRGQVAFTKELSTVAVMLTSAGILSYAGRFFMQQCSDIITQTLSTFMLTGARSGDYVPAVIFVVKKGLFIAVPMMVLLAIVGVLANVLQTGLLHNEEALQFDINKLNPIDGMKKLMSLRAVVEGLKGILKLVVILSVVLMLVKDRLQQLPTLVSLSVEQLIGFAGDLTIRLLGGVGVFMAVLAAADYFYQRWELEKQMRMTKQEIKEEHKSREGDPMIKARIRRIQREMANKAMMQDVPKATVVVTNPTHIACALMYDPATMAAPILVAKGAGAIAERIKAIAREHNVPVMENKPLARTIFKTLKIGRVVPRELFTAVAQVLSYVYKLKRKGFR